MKDRGKILVKGRKDITQEVGFKRLCGWKWQAAVGAGRGRKGRPIRWKSSYVNTREAKNKTDTHPAQLVKFAAMKCNKAWRSSTCPLWKGPKSCAKN